jgi:streptogramin lyase
MPWLTTRARGAGLAVAAIIGAFVLVGAAGMPGPARRSVARSRQTVLPVAEFARPFFRPVAIAAGPDGNLWFTDDAIDHPAIGRITSSGEIIEFSAGLRRGDCYSPSLVHGSCPDEIVAGPDGNLWFTDDGIPAVGRITPQGKITEFTRLTLGSGRKRTFAQLGSVAEDLVAGPGGEVWFVTFDPPTAVPAGGVFAPAQIARITPAGKIIGYRRGLLGRWSQPGSLTVGADGDLWFTDGRDCTSACSGAIGRITPDGRITEYRRGLGHPGDPQGLLAAPNGDLWFTTPGSEQPGGGRDAIGRITPTGAITLFRKGLGPPGNLYPWALLADHDGNIWFSDGSRGLGRITPSGTLSFLRQGLAGDGAVPVGLAPHTGGGIWISDLNVPTVAIGSVTPSGQLTEYRARVNPDTWRGQEDGPRASRPTLVPGPDRNLWFASQGVFSDIGRITTAQPN